MTGQEYQQILEDADKKGQSHSGQQTPSDNIFISKDEMEAEDHNANIRDKNVRTGITEDVRPMRRRVVWFAMLLPIVLLVFLGVQVYFYFGMLDTLEGNMVVKAMAAKAMATPMTALIIGTFVCVTAIYSALLLGLFRSVSESRGKLTMADVHPLIDFLRKANITGG